MSYIGVILSIVFIILTIVSYAANKLVMYACVCLCLKPKLIFPTHRKLRSSDHGRLLLNLCAALLGLYIMFIFAVHSSNVRPLCAIVSIMLQYFMLVVFMVMGAEAINLYVKLVVVLGYVITHFVLKATIICWGEFTL